MDSLDELVSAGAGVLGCGTEDGVGTRIGCGTGVGTGVGTEIGWGTGCVTTLGTGC